MTKKTLLIADDNRQLLNELCSKISARDDIEVVATALDGMDALAKIEEFHPDFLLLDIVMPELDGYGVMSALSLSSRGKRPIVMVMSQLCADGFISKALRLGASYFFAKPVQVESVLAFIDDCCNPSEPSPLPESTPKMFQAKPAARVNRSLDEKIANIFISVGIPAHIKGYQFLREAIKLAVDSPEVINSITKRLYPSVAQRFETSPSKVERAIRHAIEVAWNRGKIENINTIFGVKVYSANDKPTNGEFIALVADKMLLEGV